MQQFPPGGQGNWGPPGGQPGFGAPPGAPPPMGAMGGPPPMDAPPPMGTPMGGGAPKTNTLAVVGMALGIFVLVLGWACAGPLFAIGGLACSLIGMSQINKSNGAETGKGFAIAGVIMNGLGLVATIVFAIIAFSAGLLGNLLKVLH